jgi:hypothetical protein
MTFGGWLAVAVSWVFFRRPSVPLFSRAKLWQPHNHLTPIGTAVFCVDPYTLQEAGFAFYCGPRTQLHKVFRAEWSIGGIERAAHPHWHADCTIIGSNLGISRVHFGMGGWSHKGEGNACWHAPAEGIDTILDWAVKTLHYCREQLEHYPPN